MLDVLLREKEGAKIKAEKGKGIQKGEKKSDMW